jgi:hypothetical protein
MTRVISRVAPRVWIGIAAGALAVGYADLWRGGMTVSAVLLTVGYTVLVPIAILAVPHDAARRLVE